MGKFFFHIILSFEFRGFRQFLPSAEPPQDCKKSAALAENDKTFSEWQSLLIEIHLSVRIKGEHWQPEAQEKSHFPEKRKTRVFDRTQMRISSRRSIKTSSRKRTWLQVLGSLTQS
jgi:hypothetical protein